MKNINPGLMMLIILISSCSPKNSSDKEAKSHSYVLTGEVKGFQDSTWLFLDNILNGSFKEFDSTMVLQGQFNFTGSVPDSVTSARFILRTENYSDYKYLWIENSQIHFKGEKGNFRKADITGSKAQSEEDLHTQITSPMQKAADSLRTLLNEPAITEIRKQELNKLLAQSEERKNNETFEFIRKHPNSLVSANLLSVYSSAWGRKKTMELYNLLSGDIKNTAYGKNINRYITLNKDIKIGDKFADFEQVNYKDKKVKLSDFKGKIVLLEFWAAWCGPCRQENPALVKTYQAYKDKGFEILGVSLDDTKKHWIGAIEKDGLIWENVSELNGARNSAALIYGISGIPDNFLIDRTGTIIKRNLRGEKLSNKLRELLK